MEGAGTEDDGAFGKDFPGMSRNADGAIALKEQTQHRPLRQDVQMSATGPS